MAIPPKRYFKFEYKTREIFIEKQKGALYAVGYAIWLHQKCPLSGVVYKKTNILLPLFFFSFSCYKM